VKRLRAVVQIIQEECPDIVHLFMDGVPGAYGRLATLITRHPRVIVGIRNHPIRDPAWYAQLTRLLLNRHITLFISNAVASQEYLVEHQGVLRHKSRYIPNGIELRRFQPDHSNTYKKQLFEDWSDKIIVGTVGALAVRKSPDVFVQVARRVIDQCPDVRFIHAGDGPLRERIHNLSHEMGLDSHLHFLGSRADVPDVLRAMDIFILTSSNEGTPNAAMEAMATDLPCIATDTGDCKVLIVEGKTGLIAPVGDVEQLAGHVLRLIGDATLRRSMGQSGYERIQDYSVHKMAQRYQDIYQEVLAE
jgi:glycosyltransferase involved in cell wall biosynthesis